MGEVLMEAFKHATNTFYCKECGTWITRSKKQTGVHMSKERVKNYRARQKEVGRLKREMYLTDSEYEQLKEKTIDATE